MICPKSGYPSERIAQEQFAKRVPQNRTLDLWVYHCRACGKWHLTSKPDRYPPQPDEEVA